MAELTPRERLQPSLLDRLIDDEPDKQQESREQRVLSLKKLRDCVLRDLAWLFNTTNLNTVQDLSGYPLVQQSVLNFGLPDLSGQVLAGQDLTKMELMLKQAILDFEPRILRNTVKVRLLVDDKQMNMSAMVFEIEGDLWAQPLPQRLYLRTEVDLELSTVNVTDAVAPRS